MTFKLQLVLETKLLPLGQLFVDAENGVRAIREGLTTPEKLLGYQRDRTRKVDEILVKGFRSELLLPLVVNRRGPNKYSIVDGGTRFTVLKELGVSASTKVWCTIGDLPIGEEAGWFVDLNSLRVKISLVEEFRAQYVSRDSDAVEIHDTLAKYGFAISNSSIRAVGNVREARRKGVLDDVGEVLSLWKGKAKATEGKLITGLTQFLSKAKDDPAFDMGVFLRVMQKTTPVKIIDEANIFAAERLRAGYRSTVGGSYGIRSEAAFVLLGMYNKGRTKKLDEAAFRMSDEDAVKAS